MSENEMSGLMNEHKKIVFRNFRDDLDAKIRKNKKFELLFRIEVAKLKIADKFYQLLGKLRLT